jgi:hypothetical protein
MYLHKIHMDTTLVTISDSFGDMRSVISQVVF